MLLSMGISGYGLVGDDIGGSPVRLRLRAHPLDRGGRFQSDLSRPHGQRHRRPGAVGARTGARSNRKRYIEERYRLLPYIYTGVEEMSRTGIPLMRPLLLEYPQSPEFFDDDREFMFGHDILFRRSPRNCRIRK